MQKVSRRKFFIIGMASLSAIAVGTVISRLYGVPTLASWQGSVLSKRHAYLLVIAAQEFIPGQNEATYLQVVVNIDVFLSNLPVSLVGQIRAAIEAFENMTFLDIQFCPFSQMSSQSRQSYLQRLFACGGLLRLIGKTVRDLCLLGYYQQDVSWKQLDYLGPIIKTTQTMDAKYASLMASPGVVPKSLKNHTV